jgi:hypothetical protein
VPLFKSRHSNIHAVTASAFYELVQYGSLHSDTVRIRNNEDAAEFHAEIDSAIAFLFQYEEPGIRAVTASALANLADHGSSYRDIVQKR